jgi:mannose-1-phosphate guanylyltransferase
VPFLTRHLWRGYLLAFDKYPCALRKVVLRAVTFAPLRWSETVPQCVHRGSAAAYSDMLDAVPDPARSRTSGAETPRERNKNSGLEASSIRNRSWAVILAGGQGSRLRSLTKLISGDDTPKQFCPLLAGRTLLAHTRERVARGIPTERTLFVLVREQERFYARELSDVSAGEMIVQPANRGTLPAILYSILQILSVDPDAVVSFFPSDHYYANEKNFMAGMELAFRAAEADSQALILLAAPATHPETDYGWIEAEAATSYLAHNGLLRIKRFWEKPSAKLARDLLGRGCVWNTFVMTGHARAFLNTIRVCATELCHAFESAYGLDRRECQQRLKALYADLSTTDFSSQVLARSVGQLRVLCLGDVGWSDLGNPQRLIEVLAGRGETADWLTLWRQGAAGRASRAESSAKGLVAGVAS